MKGKKTRNAQYSYTQVYTYTRVKVRLGTCENELGDQLAKESTTNRDAMIFYNKVPKGTLIREMEEESIKNGRKNALNVRRQQ